ncbi:MAG: hypothetical protein Q9192_001046 [Flavoplaca navasiana]
MSLSETLSLRSQPRPPRRPSTYDPKPDPIIRSRIQHRAHNPTIPGRHHRTPIIHKANPYFRNRASCFLRPRYKLLSVRNQLVSYGLEILRALRIGV